MEIQLLLSYYFEARNHILMLYNVNLLIVIIYSCILRAELMILENNCFFLLNASSTWRSTCFSIRGKFSYTEGLLLQNFNQLLKFCHFPTTVEQIELHITFYLMLSDCSAVC